MSDQTKPSEGMTFRLNPPRQPLNVAFLNTAHTITIPVLNLKLVPDPTQYDDSVEIKMPPKLYDAIKQTHFTDQLVLYLPTNGLIGIWTYDMVIAIGILSSLGIINNLETWISIARDSVVKLLSNEKVNSKKDDKIALKLSEEMLASLRILEEVKSNTLLSLTARDVITEKIMDSDTIIHRLALALYHAKFISGQSVISIIEDEGELYLRLIQSEIYTRYKEKFRPLMELPIEDRVKTTKVFIAFLIAAYIYYREASGE